MLKSYGRYSVMIADDGAIKVRKDDWISKYSAAIHRGDTKKINEYGRLHGNKMIPLQDPNRIITGETIYHLPTRAMHKLKKSQKMLNGAIEIGKSLQSKIRELKWKRSIDQKEVERLEREAEKAYQIADDAAAECSDAYSCIGAGAASMKFAHDAQNFEKEAQKIRNRVHTASKSIEELENRLQKNLEQQERLQRVIQNSMRTMLYSIIR